jgi:hypothetical protein
MVPGLSAADPLPHGVCLRSGRYPPEGRGSDYEYHGASHGTPAALLVPPGQVEVSGPLLLPWRETLARGAELELRSCAKAHSSRAQQTARRATLSSTERLQQIFDQVVGVFESDGQTQQVLGSAGSLSFT